VSECESESKSEKARECERVRARARECESECKSERVRELEQEREREQERETEIASERVQKRTYKSVFWCVAVCSRVLQCVAV